MGFMYRKMQELFDASIAAVGQPFEVGVREVGYVAFDTLVWLSLPLLALARFLGVMVEFLRVGPIVTAKKLTPKLDKLNPVDGIQQLFSQDKLVDLRQSIVDTRATSSIRTFEIRGLCHGIVASEDTSR